MSPTAVHQKPAPAPAAVQPKPAKILFEGRIDIEKIDVVLNIRKTFDPVKLKELSENIKTEGVDQPLLLRPSEKAGRYILVDGERRLRAAKMAGLESVPVIVKDISEKDAIVKQMISFLQRDGLGPIEEARGFKLLLETKNEKGQPKYTVEMIAGRVGRHEGYVYRAVRLADLPAMAIKLIESGELTSTHGHHLLRLAEKQREETLKGWMDNWRYREGHRLAKDLADFIESTLGSDLTKAQFPKDKEYAGAGACTGCPSNSGNQGMLIPGAEKGMCTFRKCFDQKLAQHRVDTIAKIKAKYPDALEIEVQDPNHWIGKGTYRNGWSVKDELVGKAPKVPYKLTINPDLKVYYWTKNKAAKKPVASGPKAKPADPKDDFIATEVDKEFGRALAKHVHKKPIDGARSVAQFEVDNYYGGDATPLEILGIKTKAELEKRVKASKSIEELLQITLVLRASDNGEYEFEAGNVGVDMKATRKAAEAAAEKAWTAKQAVAAKAKA